MAWTIKYYLKNNYLILKSKSHDGHYGMQHTALWSCTHIPNKYYSKTNYLTLRSKVITVRDTPHDGHAPTYQISLTYLKRQKCYGPDKKILFKKQLFDLEVKGQGPTKVIMVCDTPQYGHAPTYQISLTYPERQKCYGPDKKILFKNNYLTLKSKSHEGHYGMWHTALWSCSHTK